MCVMFDRKHLDTVNNQTIYLNNGFTLCRWELIITWMWLSPVCIPVMRPFRVRCGLAGRNSSMSLSEPSSSGTSMSESSSFTVDDISCESSVKSYRKVWMGLCDRFLSLTLCLFILQELFISSLSSSLSLLCINLRVFSASCSGERKQHRHKVCMCITGTNCMNVSHTILWDIHL